MTLPIDVEDGDLSHLSHHNTLHARYNNGVDILSGLASARPLATAVDAGTLYWSTDSSTFSRSDGATWSDISAGASAHADLTGVSKDQHHNEDHAARHASAGADPIAPADIGAAPAAQGVTNGNTHDHAGGDGAQIAHSSLGSVTANQHHNEDHAARHADGGADELDVANLASGAATLGQVPTADGAGAVAWQDPAGGGATVVFKTADETVTSSSTFQDDDALLFAVGANENWTFEIILFYDAATTADIKVQLTGPSGATVKWFGIADIISSTAAVGLFTDAEVGTTNYGGGAGSGTRQGMLIRGSVENGATAGNVTLQWAQATSNATGTVVQAGSYLVAHQV